MEYNTLLIWIVVISCGGMLARIIWTRSWRRDSWAILCIAVLLTTSITYFFRPRIAGFVGGILWALLFLGPSLLNRGMLWASMRHKFFLGETFARIARLLHPMDGWWDQPQLLHALGLAEKDDVASAREILMRLAGEQPQLRRLANLQSLRISRQWHELISWADFDLGESINKEATLSAMYIRALGETGALNEMIDMLAKASRAMSSQGHAYTRAMSRLFVFAFSGDVAEVEALCKEALAHIPADAREFWRATAELATGNVEQARAKFRELEHSASPAIRAASRFRIETPIARADDVLSPASRALLARFARERAEEDRFSGRIGPRRGRRAVTAALVIVNLLLFVVEIIRGGSQNEDVLKAMGAVDSRIMTQVNQSWRLIAANFLHYGFAHIAFNMLALLVLGPFVEAALGKVRYFAIYMLSGVFALASSIALLSLGWIRFDFLVGASGCIMGIVGATIAILLRGRIVQRAEIATQRLGAVLLIVAVQVVFDYMTPEVSSTAHIAGLLAGFGMTLLVRHRTSAPRRDSEALPTSQPKILAS